MAKKDKDEPKAKKEKKDKKGDKSSAKGKAKRGDEAVPARGDAVPAHRRIEHHQVRPLGLERRHQLRRRRGDPRRGQAGRRIQIARQRFGHRAQPIAHQDRRRRRPQHRPRHVAHGLRGRFDLDASHRHPLPLEQ